MVLDLHVRRVIGWALSCKPDAELVVRALDMAYEQRGRPHQVMFHLALLHIEGNDCLSLGDYLDACNAAEEFLPSLCRLAATVSIAGRANRFDLQLALFSPCNEAVAGYAQLVPEPSLGGTQ